MNTNTFPHMGQSLTFSLSLSEKNIVNRFISNDSVFLLNTTEDESNPLFNFCRLDSGFFKTYRELCSFIFKNHFQLLKGLAFAFPESIFHIFLIEETSNGKDLFIVTDEGETFLFNDFDEANSKAQSLALEKLSVDFLVQLDPNILISLFTSNKTFFFQKLFAELVNDRPIFSLKETSSNMPFGFIIYNADTPTPAIFDIFFPYLRPKDGESNRNYYSYPSFSPSSNLFLDKRHFFEKILSNFNHAIQNGYYELTIFSNNSDPLLTLHYVSTPESAFEMLQAFFGSRYHHDLKVFLQTIF